MEVPGSDFYECASCGAQLPSIEAVQGHACPKHTRIKITVFDWLRFRWRFFWYRPKPTPARVQIPTGRSTVDRLLCMRASDKDSRRLRVQIPTGPAAPTVIEVPEVDLTG